MICIDPRTGSIGLPKLFPQDLVLVMELPACDILLTDPTGQVFWSGIEFKRINDLLNCMVTGRFAGTQLPAMSELVEDYWLLVEGPIKEGKNGELMVATSTSSSTWYHAHIGGRHFNWDDLQTWMITMSTLTPLKIKVTQSRLETRAWVLTLHAWWERGKDKHKSHMAIDRSKNGGQMVLVKPSILRRWAAECAGIGHSKSVNAEAYFDSAFELAVADPSEWARIDGIGLKMAERIVEEVRRGKQRHK